VKAVGVTGYSYIRAPHIFLNRGTAWSKSGPGLEYSRNSNDVEGKRERNADKPSEPVSRVADKDVVVRRSTLKCKQHADAVTQLVDLVGHCGVTLMCQQRCAHATDKCS